MKRFLLKFGMVALSFVGLNQVTMAANQQEPVAALFYGNVFGSIARI